MSQNNQLKENSFLSWRSVLFLIFVPIFGKCILFDVTADDEP